MIIDNPIVLNEPLDMDEAARVLMRAGVATRLDIARQLAVDVVLTALTGERYDVDDDRLTPEQRRHVAEYGWLREDPIDQYKAARDRGVGYHDFQAEEA